MSSPSQLNLDLRKVRELLEDPSHWMKKGFSRIDPKNGQCFCLDGAAYHATGTPLNDEGIMCFEDHPEVDSETPRYKAVFQALRTAIGSHLWDFNDHRETKHADVLRVIDAAIEANP